MTHDSNIHSIQTPCDQLYPENGCSSLHLTVSEERHYGNGTDSPCTLVTGATGFVGSMLLCELLHRGIRCLVLMREPVNDRQGRLFELLKLQGIDAYRMMMNRQLRVLPGSLPDRLPKDLGYSIRNVIHVAGSTQFHSNASGEPTRTNDDGTQRLLAWMNEQCISEIHHVSTAYVFGDSLGRAPEAVSDSPRKFRNAYERSKWLGERHVWQWGADISRSATIYRPSIVVGDWKTGYASRFSGPYLAFEVLDSMTQSDQLGMDRPLCIDAWKDSDLNLISVDYLVGLMASILEHPSCHGRVYNIVHPDPISTSSLFEMFERIFGVPCGHRSETECRRRHERSDFERRFKASIRHLSAYLKLPPRFERANTAMAEERFARTCPSWDEPAIERLIEYARRQGWGRAS